MRRRVTKIVLKEAARGLLPDAVVDQQKVGFFNAAMSQWIVSRGRRSWKRAFSRRIRPPRIVRSAGALTSRPRGRTRRGIELTSLDRDPDARTVAVDGPAAGNDRGSCSSRRMTARSLSYAVVTPARNERTNLPRLAACLVEQTVQPSAWVIVDDGSTDGTAELAQRLADEHSWMEVVTIEGDPTPARGGPLCGRSRQASNTSTRRRTSWRSSTRISRSAGSLGAAAGRVLRGRVPRHRGWHVLGGAAGRLEAAIHDPEPRSRSREGLSTRLSRRRPSPRAADGVGWDRRAEGGGERVANEELPPPGSTPSPTPGRARRSARQMARPGEMAHFMGYRPSYLLFRALYRGMRDPSRCR